MRSRHIRCVAAAGCLAAPVFVFTAFLHIPAGNGYVHPGDAFVYLGACLLPLPYSALVAAIGALLADFVSGYALWIPASVAIKTLSVFFFTSKTPKLLTRRNALALIAASAVSISGYYLYEAMVFKSFAAPLASVPANAIQAAASSILFTLICAALDRGKIKFCLSFN